MPKQPIEINIEIVSAVITCTPNGGNLRGRPGQKVIFRTKDTRREFNLEFFTLTEGGDDSPFEGGTTTGVVTATEPFTVTLGKWPSDRDLGTFEYTITAGSLMLDPVIVMEKE